MQKYKYNIDSNYINTHYTLHCHLKCQCIKTYCIPNNYFAVILALCYIDRGDLATVLLLNTWKTKMLKSQPKLNHIQTENRSIF